jgi:polysaccharide export outer membrane protein
MLVTSQIIKNYWMKNRLLFFMRVVFFLAFGAYILSSCVPMKRIKYLQQEVEKNDTLKTTFINNNNEAYKIQPGDNLYIMVNSTLAGADNFFSNEEVYKSSNYYNDAGIYLNSYMVSDSGYVDFPFVGKIYVKELSIEQSKNLIQGIVDEYLKETTVIVKLAIFKVTVIGEVNRPGTVNIYQNKLNVFELISMAGDLTSFAKRNKVYLIRETQNGSKVKELNLNDVNILESDYYYIQPDDILYVPPVKAKNFAFGNFPYALIFTTITTTLLLINFFQTN